MAETSFRVDEVRLSAIFRVSMDCIVVVNRHGQIVEFNPAAEKAFGYSRKFVMKKSLAEVMLPSVYREPYLRLIADYLETGEEAIFNQRLHLTALRADKTEFPVEVTVVPAQSDGDFFFISVIRDLTEYKHKEQKLWRTGARLQRLVESLQGGVLLENEMRQIELVNKAFCTMFGIQAPPAALVGQDCSQSAEDFKDLFVDSPGFASRIERILHNRQLVLEDVLHLSDGRVFTRDYVPIFNDDEYVGHLWHYHDVSQEFRTRRRWEQLLKLEELNKEIIRLFLQSDDIETALNETLALTGQLLDVSRVYVFHFRANERILDNTHEWCAPGVSPEIENLKGLLYDEVLPSFLPLLAEKGIIAPYHIDELPVDVRDILETQNIRSLLILPLYFGNRIEGFIGCDENRSARSWLPEEITTIRIITESYTGALERQRARQLLIEARDAALHVAQLRSQFVANMSHEIRTPMTGVMGMLELLRETDLNEEQAEFATEAFNSAYRLLNIINDILDFSKLEAGRMVLQSETIDLRAIVDQVRMMVAAQVGSKPLVLEVDIPADVPRLVIGDSTRLRQVLMNLVSNAIKFTAQGQVSIRLYLLAEEAQEAWIRFEVSDTGIGIPAEHLSDIFESFVQVDGTLTRKFGGTGLGLAISKQLVDLMGGTIDVESVPGQGSTFRFSLNLPVVEQVASEEVSKVNSRGSQTPTKSVSQTQGETPIGRILLAEDYPMNVDLVKHALQDIGIQVDAVEDGEAVLERLQQGVYDLVLMDMHMPVMDGKQATKLIRASSADYRQIPILALTASVMTDELESYFKLGINGVIEKPFLIEDLRNTVQKWLSQPAQ